MKARRFVFGLIAAGVLLTLASCSKDPVFDGDLIVGKWVSGTEYYRYDADSKGVTWDTGDDVQEEEGQPFTWSFDSETNRLTLVHQMEMGAVVPKAYTLTALNDSTMEYKDNYGQKFKYKRVVI
jgi:hypothetical protein